MRGQIQCPQYKHSKDAGRHADATTVSRAKQDFHLLFGISLTHSFLTELARLDFSPEQDVTGQAL
jgi:hypothetical protein